MRTTQLASEWSLLQNQCDSYEKHSLLIKLTAIVLLGATHFCQPESKIAIAGLIAVLWLQDAIWKTFQRRIEERLLRIEALLAASQAGSDVDGVSNGVAYQFNTEFQAQRQGIAALLKEYFSQALRPTIAFPYVALLLLLV